MEVEKIAYGVYAIFLGEGFLHMGLSVSGYFSDKVYEIRNIRVADLQS